MGHCFTYLAVLGTALMHSQVRDPLCLASFCHLIRSVEEPRALRSFSQVGNRGLEGLQNLSQGQGMSETHSWGVNLAL